MKTQDQRKQNYGWNHIQFDSYISFSIISKVPLQELHEIKMNISRPFKEMALLVMKLYSMILAQNKIVIIRSMVPL